MIISSKHNDILWGIKPGRNKKCDNGTEARKGETEIEPCKLLGCMWSALMLPEDILWEL